MMIAVAAMFLQQTCGSVARVLPAVLAPLIILELHADPSWVGVYFGLVAIAAAEGWRWPSLAARQASCCRLWSATG
jgi:hypothetical protein